MGTGNDCKGASDVTTSEYALVSEQEREQEREQETSSWTDAGNMNSTGTGTDNKNTLETVTDVEDADEDEDGDDELQKVVADLEAEIVRDAEEVAPDAVNEQGD